MTYSQSIRLLLSLERFGMKFGLEGIARLLRVLGNPHKKFASIHIAGTNGKGSTASMLAAILTSAGYRTGLYTSPHLVKFEERIRIDGKSISPVAVAALTSRLRASIIRHKPTFFEATTAMAFQYFAEKAVDVAVVETGLGGRLDSTNVLKPIACIITNIGLEHTELLGNTIEQIAAEKAGIIKERTVCISGVSDPKAMSVLRKVSRKQKARFILATDYRIRQRERTLDGSVLDIRISDESLKNLRLSLAGEFQYGNLAVALRCVQELRRIADYDIREEAIRDGLAHVKERSGLSGRLMTIQKAPLVLADVAHNADAIVRLVEALKRLGLGKVTTVFGVLKDKDHVRMVRSLSAITEQAIAVAARSERSRSASDVAAAFASQNCRVRAALSVQEGVHLAVDSVGAGGIVLVTGSHYVVGEAMVALTRKRA